MNERPICGFFTNGRLVLMGTPEEMKEFSKEVMKNYQIIYRSRNMTFTEIKFDISTPVV